MTRHNLARPADPGKTAAASPGRSPVDGAPLFLTTWPVAPIVRAVP